MDYPFGHIHHHSHRRNDDDDQYSGHQPPPPFSSSPYPPPNQPSFDGAYSHAPSPYSDAPYQHHPSQTYPPPSEHYPPPPESGVYHSSHSSRHESQGYHPAPAPSAGVNSHSHHEEEGGGDGGHHFRPHMPGFIADRFHGHGRGDGESEHRVSESHEGDGDTLSRYFGKKPTFRVFCKAGGDRYTLAVRDGEMILAQHNPDDLTQHWYKDEKWSTKVKDAEGYPSFSLVNKATGQAVKHSVAGHPLKLIPYKPNEFDESILWTESMDLGQGFRTIRIVNNVKLSMDAFHGDADHGGVHDGTGVALYDCWKGDNQQWKIVPYSYCTRKAINHVSPLDFVKIYALISSVLAR